MQENGERSGVSGEDDDLRDTSVQSFCRLVCPLLQLSIVRRLLGDVEDFLGKGCVRNGPC